MIMLVTRLIASPLRVHVNFSIDLLCLGPPRNKTWYPYPPPKRNTLPPVHVVLNYFGTQTLKYYGIHVKHVPLLCDNESAIKISHKPMQHSRTKHIEVRHHFIRDHVAKGDIDLKHVRTDKQLADIFTKPLDEKVFCRLRGELNIIDTSNLE